MVKVYQRQTEQVVEQEQYQDKWLNRLYETRFGRYLQPIIVKPLFSELARVTNLFPWSRRKIPAFIEAHAINMADFEETTYPNFASFFARRVKADKRPLCSSPAVLAVADGKLRVFKIEAGSLFKVKNQTYSLAELVQDQALAQTFEGGLLCLYRLALEDCHHYLMAESGRLRDYRLIKGKLHSVRQQIQKQVPVFKENKRAYTLLETDLGPVLQMEIGALLVGRIKNRFGRQVVRGQHKGYFDLGGSAIIVIYPKDTLIIDDDLLYYSQIAIETQVRMGERIGQRKCCQD